MVYDALDALIGAKVTGANDDSITFSNGIVIRVEDIGCHIDISGYKEDSE